MDRYNAIKMMHPSKRQIATQAAFELNFDSIDEILPTFDFHVKAKYKEDLS